MKIIYLASGYGVLKHDNVTYNDLLVKRDLQCDMMSVDLSEYDILIATPPCNYYSRANYRRDTSSYSQLTKHLLPDIITKFKATGKPFIVENVRNKTLMKYIFENNKDLKIIFHGRHTYFTNIKSFDCSNVPQVSDNIQHITSKTRQGGVNVNNVIDFFLDTVIKEFSYNG